MKKPHNLDNFFKSSCEFIMGAQKFDQIKDSYLPEVAFIGRSNVGKSSIINIAVNKKIALTSKTPGRTRQLNFFLLNKQLNIVDMPGYGYAKIGKSDISAWEKLSYSYFSKRANLKKVFLLIDIRRGIGSKDKEMMNIFDSLAVSYQLVLTKIDKLKTGQLEKEVKKIEEESKKYPALHPQIISTSCEHKIGINDLRKAIIEII